MDISQGKWHDNDSITAEHLNIGLSKDSDGKVNGVAVMLSAKTEVGPVQMSVVMTSEQAVGARDALDRAIAYAKEGVNPFL